MVLFTVFTPTFNRKKYIKSVYNSLLDQDSNLFEWLIIDDGSTDNTYDLVNNLKQNSVFKIIYHYQKNSGKHVAHNKALKYANGEFVLFLDSDDELLPKSIEYVANVWKNIDNREKNKISGFLGHSIDTNKKIIGKNWNGLKGNFHLHDIYFKNLCLGEKMPIYKLKILKDFPFPKVNESIKFIPEGVIWLEISKNFKVHLLQKPIRFYRENTFNSLMKLNVRFTSQIDGKILLQKQLEFFLNDYFFFNIIGSTKILINKALFSLLTKKSIFDDLQKFKIYIRVYYFILLPLSLIRLIII